MFTWEYGRIITDRLLYQQCIRSSLCIIIVLATSEREHSLICISNKLDPC